MEVNEMDKASILNAVEVLKEYPNEFWETPLLQHVERGLLKVSSPGISNLMLKLENMQGTGSFKVRGVLNQFHNLSRKDRLDQRPLVTMSAGNYGKAFSHIAQIFNMPAVVFMPETAPENRKTMMEGFGAKVHMCPSSELMNEVTKHQKETGSLFLHSFDDPVLIAGHASAGYEAVQALREPDVVCVCCGGGGYLAGVATAMRLFGWTKARIYGVEPENACTMYESLKTGRAETRKVGPTIAAGLAPPFAGDNCLQLIQKHVTGIVLVSDEDIKRAVRILYDFGLVVEPSGAAAMAAILTGKVSDLKGKSVLVYITGGNASPPEMVQYTQDI